MNYPNQDKISSPGLLSLPVITNTQTVKFETWGRFTRKCDKEVKGLAQQDKPLQTTTASQLAPWSLGAIPNNPDLSAFHNFYLLTSRTVILQLHSCYHGAWGSVVVKVLRY